MRLRPNSWPLVVGVGAVLLAGVLAASGIDAVAGGAPTPAPLVPRATAPAGPVSAAGPAPDVALEVRTQAKQRQVRLRETVLVHTAPSADSPRPAISVLGKGMIATQLDRQGDWVLIEYGPLTGWARAEVLEPIP